MTISPSSVPPTRYQVFVGLATDVGKQRKRNEDALVELEIPIGHLLIVADGMGGYECGERAAHVAVTTLTELAVAERGDPQQCLRLGLTEANNAIYLEAEQNGRTMGATCVAAIISGGQLHVAHAGDARAYLLRATTLFPLTRDHSFVQEIADTRGPTVAGSLPTNFSHIVSRSLGVQPTVQVALRDPITLCPGDVIMLCSDGLTNMVDDTRVRSVLAGGTPREAARRLVEIANDAGGQDNISVVVARIDVQDAAIEPNHLTIGDLQHMFVRTSDGQLHPIASGIVDPSNWTVSAIVVDLRNAKKGATCTLSTAELGPVDFGKQTMSIPQSTEALMQMGELGMWRSDAKQGHQPGHSD